MPLIEISPLEEAFCRGIAKPGATVKDLLSPYLENFIVHICYPQNSVRVQIPLLKGVDTFESYNQMVMEVFELFAHLYFFLQRLDGLNFIELERFSAETKNEYHVGSMEVSVHSVERNFDLPEIKNMVFELFSMTFKPTPKLDILIKYCEAQKAKSN